jgi:hypothetical protein
MASSAQDRIAVVYETFQAAYSRRAADLKEAKSKEQAAAILDNVDKLQIAYLEAAKQALDANGAAIEAAYQAAKAAAQEVEKAYQDAKGLADRIRAVAGAATAISQLVAKASGK